MSQKENPLRDEKHRKLTQLRALGIDPYPHSYQRTHTLDHLQKSYSHLESGQKAQDDLVVTIAGRLMTKRPMGKAAFFHLQDASGSLQIYVKLDEISSHDTQVFELLDLGDIVGVTGRMFKTQKGEVTVRAQSLSVLCKSLEPLPEKYHGLTDIEQRSRFRHLDLISSERSREVFIMRSQVIREIRQFLDARGFLEVETPVLQPIYGGAAAHPFSTHHRALDMTLYLKISPELYLKRLIVGGFEKVYDLSKNFRNEGIDRSHNPEFTMLEWYEAYTDYLDQMKQFEELIVHLCLKLRGSTRFEYQKRMIDFAPPWRRWTLHEAIHHFTNLDVAQMSDTQIFSKIKELGSEITAPMSRGQHILELFELTVEPNLWEPTFIMDFPKEICPLTKAHRTDPSLVERFEPFAACMEIGNSYTELNDPEDQHERLKAQEKKRIVDENAHPLDEDFIHAIDVGMPPTGGVGLGIERIVMILTDSSHIRDIILFPTMKLR